MAPASRSTCRLAFIRRAREPGFSLDDIGALLDLATPGQERCGDTGAIAAAHLKAVRAKIADLHAPCALLEVLDPPGTAA
ncbi:MerR family DNA-binding protein [Chelatococcus albus]|uniref:MerR family DNA-binding protein n=1 Tax=Chelatococcus albus TaxID=3047466 RepID=UPI0030EDE8C3